MSLGIGSRFGHYEVAALIGVGGMGEVYRATDTNLKREVALKVLPDEFVSDADRLARLQREAELLAALNHTNVAHIYGLERSGEKTALVMELVEGVTLAQRVQRGALPPKEALDIALQIAAALEAAHDRGIVHRDLKPANITLKADGTVKVLDFGIAKALDARATGSPLASLTTPATVGAGLVLGTAAYMAPEQARGLPVDRRVDVWAFGCVLYEMLAGKPAFLGEDVTTTIARVLERDPDMAPLPAGLAPTVRRTLELCLRKDPKERLHDIADVRLALVGAFAQDEARPERAFWRRAWPAAATFVLGALVVGAVLMPAKPPPAPAEPTPPPRPVSRFVITPPASAPLASLSGLDLVISPDGKRIAYYALKPATGNVELYVRELDALEARVLPETEVFPAGNSNPFFSPDGKSIGFFAPDRGVVRVSIDGTPSMKMFDTPAPAFLGAFWASDNTVIYSSGLRLQRMSALGGGASEPLNAERGNNGSFVAAPVLLPGGRGVLLHAIDGGATERIVALDLETGQEKTLIEGGASPSYVDTGHIVYARGTTLMAVPFDAAELSVTGEPVALVQGVRHPGLNTSADYALSATGTLAYVPASGDTLPGSAIVWVDRSGKVLGRAVPELVNAPRDPRISPDGKRLLLLTGAEGAIWSYDLAGRPPLPLALRGVNIFPVWSPDGKQIAFAGLPEGPASARIFTLPADGSVLTPRQLGPVVAALPLAWSAAGELIVLTARGSNFDIGAMTVAAPGAVRPVVASDFAEFEAALSPNGRWLAYASNRTGILEIWVQGYPEGVPVRVSTNGGHEPQWSADGRELFYLQGAAMMAVPVETEHEFSFGAPALLFTGPFFQSPTSRSYDVAHDGRFLMIEPTPSENTVGAASIVVVQNWTEELKQRVPHK
jgi:serine/threonine-protein kinase